jgi:hypothetical protein
MDASTQNQTTEPQQKPPTGEGVTAPPEPPPYARGEHYQRLFQFFLREGQLSSQGTNYTIIKRLVYTAVKNFFEYGIGCYRCGKISWNWEDVNSRHCPYCDTYHTSPQ